MTRVSSPKFQALMKEIEARESSFIRVRTSDSNPPLLSHYKIYVDGNVRTTPNRLKFLSSPYSALISVLPGTHRVVVREFDAQKQNRQETNTVQISVQDGQTVDLIFEKTADYLQLNQ